MTKELAERAYIAGFNDAMASFGKVRSVDLNAHCMLGFDGWYQRELNAMIPAPERIVEPFDFSKLPRPGDANYQGGTRAGKRFGPTVEEQEAANFAAFDPDTFVSPDEPAHMRGDDDN